MVTVTPQAAGGGTGGTPPAGTQTIYAVYTDQLDTPRMVTDLTGNVVWQWDNTDPYGNNLPNQDPNGTGKPFVNNLRYPGQYFDVETGTNYNGARNYDAATGRYLESDPLGLRGGQFSTYGYVNGDPLNHIDPTGENATVAEVGIVVGAAATLCLAVPSCRNWAVNAMASHRNNSTGPIFPPGSPIGNQDPCKVFPDSQECQKNVARFKKPQKHHICTDKSTTPGTNGGPWTPDFKVMFDRAGMSMQDPANLVDLPDHFGPHPEVYHDYVYTYLQEQTVGLEGQEYTDAFKQALLNLKTEITTPGSYLNTLVTK